MSASVEIPALSNDSSKWKLAERLEGNSELPKEFLKTVIDRMFSALENSLSDNSKKYKFDDPFKEKIWQIISGKKLQNITKFYLSAVHNQILEDFTEQEAEKLLTVENLTKSTKLALAYDKHDMAVYDTMLDHFKSLKGELKEEFRSAFKENGVPLPPLQF